MVNRLRALRLLDPLAAGLYSSVVMSNSTPTTNSATETRALDRDVHVKQALEAAGCRFTQQRAAVYAYLERVEDHPTAEEVYCEVRQMLPHISLATVYNSLEALVKAHLANRLTYGDGSSRYDCRSDDHYHLRDVSTGEVRDLPANYDADLLKKLDPQLIERLAAEGFQVTGYRLEVLGKFERNEG
jgi:Fe2+ or Zn2+ uptake regulation protein